MTGQDKATQSPIYMSIYALRSVFSICGLGVRNLLHKSSSLTSPCTHILYTEITCNADCVTHIYRSKAIRAARGEETKRGLIYKLYRREPRKGLEERNGGDDGQRKPACVTHQTRQMIMGLPSYTAGGGKRPPFKWKCINMTEESDTNEV